MGVNWINSVGKTHRVRTFAVDLRAVPYRIYICVRTYTAYTRARTRTRIERHALHGGIPDASARSPGLILKDCVGLHRNKARKVKPRNPRAPRWRHAGIAGRDDDGGGDESLARATHERNRIPAPLDVLSYPRPPHSGGDVYALCR